MEKSQLYRLLYNDITGFLLYHKLHERKTHSFTDVEYVTHIVYEIENRFERYREELLWALKRHTYG